MEDDSDEEEEGKNNAEKIVEEEEVDPLDAFMQVIITKINLKFYLCASTLNMLTVSKYY